MQIVGKITKWGNGLGLRINQEVARGLQACNGGDVTLQLDKESHVLTVRPVVKRTKWPFKEADLIKGMSKENAHADLLTNPGEAEIGE